jgi:hypothetical protein
MKADLHWLTDKRTGGALSSINDSVQTSATVQSSHATSADTSHLNLNELISRFTSICNSIDRIPIAKRVSPIPTALFLFNAKTEINQIKP